MYCPDIPLTSVEHAVTVQKLKEKLLLLLGELHLLRFVDDLDLNVAFFVLFLAFLDQTNILPG